MKEKIPSPVIMKFRVDPLRKTEKIEQRTKSKTNKSEKLGKVFKCKECIYKTKNSKCLEEHMKRVHLARQFRCSECNKEFGFRKDLRRHMKCHGKAQHSCEVCGKAYKEANKLKAHKKTHALNYVKPQFSCQHCSKSFSTKYLLSYHINSEHLGMKCSFICPTCGKSFAQKNSYLQHANLHKGVKPFSCDICKMQFSYEKSLKEHASLHDETRNFKCSVCSKTFKQSSGLKIHMRIHNDTKDYVCAMCGKEFRQRQALLRHERIHAGEKPFECCLCTKFFGDSSVLRRHMLYVHKRSLKDWQKDTQRHSKSKNINSILAVSDSPCAEKEEVKCGNQNCGDDSFENAERKSSANHVVVQKKAFSQVLNTKDSSKSERPIPSLFLKSTDQENETYNFPEGNLQIDLFADGITPASTETNPLIPTERLSGTPNLMLSPIAQVIVGPFNKLKSCHSDSTNICQTDDIPFPESVNPS
ncbi:hypothetical protein RRG08_034028 [Elysia crispata]|uniref:C2H2-type domain-containing protein n=1 Tax=Elysia crispata TaxID=231223 RepID=A0AAE0XUB1_9GAST|nr:hypothetical protein RRG08_034028 [Elysia crispata]